MIVKCRFNRGAEIGEPKYGLYFTKSSKFLISVGYTYRVYGMAIYKLGLTVLIESDTGSAKWYPVELFEVVDGEIPADWRFATRDEGESGTQAIWGYPELVDDPEHDEALIEREAAALAVFAAQVAEHRGNEHRGNEHRGNEHRGNEHRGNEHRGNEHRGMNAEE